MFFIIEEVKETILDFFQETTKYCKRGLQIYSKLL